jgi:hypothetical protein
MCVVSLPTFAPETAPRHLGPAPTPSRGDPESAGLAPHTQSGSPRAGGALSRYKLNILSWEGFG